jgi:hypothetical protein
MLLGPWFATANCRPGVAEQAPKEIVTLDELSQHERRSVTWHVIFKLLLLYRISAHSTE